MRAVLDQLLTSPLDQLPVTSVAEWQTRFVAATANLQNSADRALLAGFMADRVAYAFAGAYQAALSRLTDGKIDAALGAPNSGELAPAGVAPRITTLCITEEGGGHPSAIKTTLTPNADGSFLLRGRKQWATGGSLADHLLVAASVGVDQTGKNRLKVVVVNARATGVTFTEMPPPPFAPELPHSVVTLADVLVSSTDVLPGDGYDLYVKPFRTIEDAHIFLALVGHTVRACRAYGGKNEWIELAITAACALRQVASLDPSAPSTHVALAGALDLGRHLLTEIEPVWAQSPTDVRERWERDRGLLHVAERARRERRARAWTQLALP